MRKELENLKDEFLSSVKETTDRAKLEELRVEFLGRKGRLAQLMKKLADLAEDARKEMGQLGNEVKHGLESAFYEAHAVAEQLEEQSKREAEWIDITVPGQVPPFGSLHLATQAIDEVVKIFSRLGFVRTRNREVDWDWYAFESLNMPKNHAARDEWETFFVQDPKSEEPKVMEGKKGKVVLTPHTTNAQGHVMEKGKLPIRLITIGKTYRRQSDVTHVPMFHQFEGLMVDENVTVAELKGVFDYFVKNFFGEDRATRLRPHHFRFTEPSFELDISCDVCGGTGRLPNAKCRFCKEGWVELGGAGMVHPNVLSANGLDPEKYSGLAFGWGVERTLMMKSGMNIADMRILYKNDLRFLKQF